MKKLVLLLTVMTVVVFSAAAQVSVGAKVGANLANFGGDAEDTDMRVSLHLGGYLNYAVSESFSIQPELLYSSVGAKESESGFEASYKMNYISVPVMLIYSFGNFNIQAGPQLSFLASAKYKYDFDGDSGTEDIKEFFKGTDFGANLGVGANFGKVNASVRYSIGLANIADSDEGELKNNVIQLSLGYTLFGGE